MILLSLCALSALCLLIFGAKRLLGRKSKTEGTTVQETPLLGLPALGDGLGRAVREQFEADKTRIKELEQLNDDHLTVFDALADDYEESHTKDRARVDELEQEIERILEENLALFTYRKTLIQQIRDAELEARGLYERCEVLEGTHDLAAEGWTLGTTVTEFGSWEDKIERTWTRDTTRDTRI